MGKPSTMSTSRSTAKAMTDDLLVHTRRHRSQPSLMVLRTEALRSASHATLRRRRKATLRIVGPQATWTLTLSLRRSSIPHVCENFWVWVATFFRDMLRHRFLGSRKQK